MNHQLKKALAELDRYRELLHKRIIEDETARKIAEFGGRSGLGAVIKPQLRVREDNGRFAVIVVEPSTGLERPGVSLADLLTDMRSAADYAAAFEVKPKGKAKLANNPWLPETENVTAQALLLRNNPGLAARMRMEAGTVRGDRL